MPKNEKSKKFKKANDKKGDKDSKTRRGPQAVAPMQRKRHQRKTWKTPKPQPNEMEQEAKTTLRLQTTQKGKRTPPKKCEEERKAYQERERQIMREIERDTLSRYSFIPHLGLSTFKNGYNIIGNMPCSYYFSRPNNLAFHDLTKNKSVPLVAREIY